MKKYLPPILDMTRLLMPATGLLFVFIGVMVMRAKRNYMVGTRKPWTLANDEVWDRTHRLGGRLFVAAGVGVFDSAFGLPAGGGYLGADGERAGGDGHQRGVLVLGFPSGEQGQVGEVSPVIVKP